MPIRKQQARQIEKRYRDQQIDITLTMEELVILMDALCEFKPTRKWHPLYQDLGRILFQNVEEIESSNTSS